MVGLYIIEDGEVKEVNSPIQWAIWIESHRHPIQSTILRNCTVETWFTGVDVYRPAMLFMVVVKTEDGVEEHLTDTMSNAAILHKELVNELRRPKLVLVT